MTAGAKLVRRREFKERTSGTLEGLGCGAEESTGTVPIWIAAGARRSGYSALHGVAEADVVVVGGGVIGLMTAYECKRSGLRTVLLEADRIASGESARTTAHVTTHLDAGWKKIVHDRGKDEALHLFTASMRAIDRMESRILELGIDCDWRRVPAWRFTEREDGLEQLVAEAEAAVSAGIPAEMMTTGIPLPWPVAGAIRFHGQAQLHPLSFLEALAKNIDGDGSRIHEQTRVLSIDDGIEVRVETENGTVRAHHAIVCTHAPFNNRVLLQTKLGHYRSYVLALASSAPLLDGLYWDDADPYHYLRSAEIAGERLILVGGEDHRTGQEDDTPERFRDLERWIFERLRGCRIVRRWSGQILEPVDGLPYVGRNSLDRNVYEMTGFSGTGWAYGALAAEIIAGTLHGVENPLASSLSATRITPLASARRYLSQNAAFPWHFFGDRLGRVSKDIESLARGAGGIFRDRQDRRIAVYRDGEDHLHALSPVCPHLGCIVDFNAAESSWDCPCHGSRFDIDGNVLNGPACDGLAPIEMTPVSTAPLDGPTAFTGSADRAGP